MENVNVKGIRIASALIGVAALIYGLVTRGGGIKADCGSILFPGRHSHLCQDLYPMSAGLIWVIVAACVAVFIYFTVSDKD